MDEKELRTDSSSYNAGTMSMQLIHEQLNTAMNWQEIVGRIKAGKARDVSFEPKVDGTPAFIIGSGPSLDKNIHHLKDWKGGIFCTTSHALTLMKHGIEPTHIVALDPFCQWDELKGVDWSKTKTKLVAHPGIWPDLVEKWPNDILLYIENMGNTGTFYQTVQKKQYSYRQVGEGQDQRACTFVFYIPTEFTLFACSPPIQMFIADFLGYKTMFLMGVDFCFSDGKERFTNYTKDANNEWVENIHPFKEPETEEEKKALVWTNTGRWTKTIHLYYKKNFLTAWRLSNQTVYTTDKGAVTEMPYADVGKVVRKQGKGFPTQTKEFVAKHSETYLAGVGAFVVETANGGVSFVESKEPAKEMPAYLYDLDSMYVCSNCKNQLRAPDRNDHSHQKCPHCNQGELTKAFTIDIDYNIKKFQRLLEANDIKVNPEEWKLPVLEIKQA